MLVLSRYVDESVMIGDDIEVTVIQIKGDRVRLGFSAPKSIPVHRKEIFDTIKRECEKSSQKISHVPSIVD